MDVRFVPSDLRRFDELKAEALVLPFASDERPLRAPLGLVDWRLCGQLSRLLLRGRASGVETDAVLVPARPRLPFDKLFLFGVGPTDAMDDVAFDAAIERMLTTLDRAQVRASVLRLPGRHHDRIAPMRAMEIFLSRAAAHPEQDQVTLIEEPDAQRAMAPVLERARRRERALDEDP